MEIKEVEKYYEKLSNDEIIRIATTEVKGLREEVYEIIQNEIDKRDLNPDILKGAYAQNKEFTIYELDKYSNLLRNLPCPICSSPNDKLNGTKSYILKSFIFFSVNSEELSIACPNCLDMQNNKANLITALLGWWGIPSVFKTPIYIYRNLKAKKENRADVSTKALIEFTQENIGKIEVYKNDDEKLKEIIAFKL